MAQSPSEGYNPCLLAQASLDEKFGINPGLQNSDVGMLRALVAPVNTGGRIFNPLPERALPTADGKVKITASILPFICDESSLQKLTIAIQHRAQHLSMCMRISTLIPSQLSIGLSKILTSVACANQQGRSLTTCSSGMQMLSYGKSTGSPSFRQPLTWATIREHL
jgi:hypothetical protein